MKPSGQFFAAVLTIFLIASVPHCASAQKMKAKSSESAPSSVSDEILLKSMKARSIGPAIMGGRVSSIALDSKDPFTFYVGLGTGGVMKTSDDGATFSAIFEKEPVASIGAITVDPSNPKSIWVGTGEANDRNSSSWGDGVYHSTDGGATWKNVGLKESKTIARIAVNPKDSNTVFVAAMGDLWNPGGERGLYRTTDGGKTWKPVLTASKDEAEKVGCGDVVIADSNIVYAALYARRRTPWSFVYGSSYTDGKDAGGIFKSTDGGTTWKKLSNGLPALTGRICLDVFQKNPNVIYAVVQSDEGGTVDIDNVHSKSGGVFRSENGGETWTRLSPLDPRPFYFSQIRVDPVDMKRVYVLGFMLHVSDDSGKTFQENFFKNIHSDCHALAIDPRTSKTSAAGTVTHCAKILLGTDGGIYQSFNGGSSWAFLNKFAGGEFYHVITDMSTPYRVAGGLQDNLNWVGPSMTYSKEGITNCDWTNLGGGDGFYCVFDPHDPNVMYAESQEGYVHSINLKTGETRGLRPQPAEGETGFRFHWNAPLIPSIHDTGAMYLGGNRVFKLYDHGKQWKAISPDLSTQNLKRILTTGSGAENYGVVYALAESPVKAGMLWAGTDDGKLWVTENEGGTWTDLSGYLPKTIKGEWISCVEPGHFDSKTAYLSVIGYPSGNYAPLVFKTTDEGKTWKSVAGNLPADGPVRVIREDLHNPKLLFAGTEFGLFISFDGGEKWTKFGGLPTVAVDDMTIQPRDRDLVIATHGRSLYILDDIQPLEAFVDSVREKPLTLFPPRPAYGFYPNEGWVESSGSAVYRGSNPPEGAMITFFIKEYTGDPAAVTITNAAGRTVANINSPGVPGFNRVTWDLRPSAEFINNYGGEGRKFMASGEYTVTVKHGKETEKQKFQVNIAPGIETR